MSDAVLLSQLIPPEKDLALIFHLLYQVRMITYNSLLPHPAFGTPVLAKERGWV